MATNTTDGRLTVGPPTARRARRRNAPLLVAYVGSEPMFRTAGYQRVRGVLPKLPRGWTPRVTMRATCTSRSTA